MAVKGGGRGGEGSRRNLHGSQRGSLAGSEQDGGLYVVWLRLSAPCKVRIGALGAMQFQPGIYAYVGSAQRNRDARIRRHLRLDKPLRWHFDYLRPCGTVVAVSLAEGDRAGECILAERLRVQAGAAIEHPRFGASDCRCPGHLLYRSEAPDFVLLDKALGTTTLRIG